MLRVEDRLGRPLEVELRRLYWDEGLTLAQIGVDLGVDATTVSRWMAALGIEARFPGQRAKAVA
jgi:DNA-binding transcriptional regulator LsrR (DeoR family)